MHDYGASAHVLQSYEFSSNITNNNVAKHKTSKKTKCDPLTVGNTSYAVAEWLDKRQIYCKHSFYH